MRAYWKPDGTNIDTINEGKLKEWMKANGLATGPGDITMFLRGDDKADMRVRAAQELLQK